MAQAIAIGVWADRQLDLQWTATDALLLAATLAGSTCLFCGLIVLQATLAFWTTESLEVMNTVTYGGVQTAQYPMAIYRTWFRRFFTFVIPLGCVPYLPVVALLDRPDPLGVPLWAQVLAPAAGLLFLLASALAWRGGVRHYTSTRS